MIRVAAAAAALAVALTACGASSSGGGLSPSEYRAKVNALCTANNAQIKALPAGTQNSLAGLNKEYAIALATLHKIKAVAPPSSLAGTVKTWVGVLDQEETAVTKILNDLKTGQTAQAELAAAQAQALVTQDDLDAKKLGLAACAASVQPGGG